MQFNLQLSLHLRFKSLTKTRSNSPCLLWLWTYINLSYFEWNEKQIEENFTRHSRAIFTFWKRKTQRGKHKHMEMKGSTMEHLSIESNFLTAEKWIKSSGLRNILHFSTIGHNWIFHFEEQPALPVWRCGSQGAFSPLVLHQCLSNI